MEHWTPWFLNHLCDEELERLGQEMEVVFLNHLCDEEQLKLMNLVLVVFLNHLCDEEPAWV
ncbi:hypothetical protein [Acinetobacter nosocomialis]|uniref:hypothetical protein n=1 Tax=Acinetobacter nosocomialis TaxID=106654 RepID=UPI001ADD524C|nr:hypothetical protein [Acinetobacter nosocomialis]MBO8226689.1 hypothetical protein [Acinetobacter nosocomialis]